MLKFISALITSLYACTVPLPRADYITVVVDYINDHLGSTIRYLVPCLRLHYNLVNLFVNHASNLDLKLSHVFGLVLRLPPSSILPSSATMHFLADDHRDHHLLRP